MLVLTIATQTLPVFSTYEWKPFRTWRAIPLDSKIEAWQTNQQDVSQLLFLNDWKILLAFKVESMQMNRLGRNWPGGHCREGEREWDAGCTLSWGIGILCTVLLNSPKEPQTWICLVGSLVNFDWPYCPAWQKFSLLFVASEMEKWEQLPSLWSVPVGLGLTAAQTWK